MSEPQNYYIALTCAPTPQGIACLPTSHVARCKAVGFWDDDAVPKPDDGVSVEAFAGTTGQIVQSKIMEAYSQEPVIVWTQSDTNARTPDGGA